MIAAQGLKPFDIDSLILHFLRIFRIRRILCWIV